MVSPKLIRCSVKDLASCFYSCGFPNLDEEEEPQTLSSRQPMISEETAAASKKDMRGEKEPEKQLSNSPSPQRTDLSRGSPRFSDKDYIVFRFKENGQIDVMDDGAQSSQQQLPSRCVCQRCRAPIDAASLRPISKKLIYKEGFELRNDSKRVMMPNQDKNKAITNGKGILISDTNKDEEKGKGKDPNTPRPNKIDHLVDDSCGSNRSSGTSSASSFSFPELGVEWIGSPVHLPKPDREEEVWSYDLLAFG
ncbi:protein BREAKING OF ASYMMETRY IN THE STOMATAL LINEAGE-like [Andrographis paniculata]|uniref:protein BREAKING OF ASYMMETRY IN THE STOMATAL LINEAGE-like n=1 Tax=Andrographis paniculata TaxID=175694 RepID=UPI0021E92103|nr:protein BREAKING OF ASYMMETRY IN THE STOMATAL LINEAGE-like [Andrographis paniculata]